MTAALSSGRGYSKKVLLYIAAYIVPSALVWGGIGALFLPLRGHLWSTLIACLYSLGYGTVESLAFSFRPLSLAWQVPAQWLHGRSALAQTLIWGVFLGPGLLTRNPYAGMWVLPLLVIGYHHTAIMIGLSMAVGAAHGVARALGALHNYKQIGESCSSSVILTQWRWRAIDGLALLLVGSMLSVYILSSFFLYLSLP